MNVSDMPLMPPAPWHVTPGERAIWETSDPYGYDREWRHELFEKLPLGFGEKLAGQYRKDWRGEGRKKANTRLRITARPFLESGLPLLADEDQLVQQARIKADHCRRIMSYHADSRKVFEALCVYAVESGINPIKLSAAISQQGAIRRFCWDDWWKRQLRKAQGMAIETGAIYGGLVQNRRNIYVSDENLERQREQSRRTRSILESLVAVNELDDSYTLQELADLSVSNPVILRNEMMTRIMGTELFADTEGFLAFFLTLTCPSRFHARYSKSGEENPNYDGSTPKQGQAYLNKIWSLMRSRWKDHGLEVFGVRIAEPHHDGTPHWHILIFLKEKDKDLCLDFFKKYALKDSPDEAGALIRRFKIEEIDKSRGSAVGYVAKYISKNIDGYGVEYDELGNDAASSAERVRTWAKTWGIRQFQFFGVPPVTVWRELRRIHSEISGSAPLERARQAADTGNWAEYIYAMDGVCISRDERPIALIKVWSDKPNRYDEPVGEIIVGVTTGDITIQTRIHVWTIGKKVIEEGVPNSDDHTYSTWDEYTGAITREPKGSNDPLGLENNFGQRPVLTYLEFCQ
ncbi:MAG: replication endonuclease [Sedimenticola sp.]|nr:MAG: replication endonuclease [Sedimenticola sp.]